MNADEKKKSVKIICENLRCEASVSSVFSFSSVSASYRYFENNVAFV